MESNQVSQWIERYGQTLYHYARPRLMGDEELDKVLGDVIARAFDKDNAGKSSADPAVDQLEEASWLVSILRKSILEHYHHKYAHREMKELARREMRQVLSQSFEPQVDLHQLDCGMLDTYDGDRFWMAVNDCLSQLPRVQAEVFILREMEDVPCEEICAIFGLSLSDVLDVIFRARMIFVKCLLRFQSLPDEQS